MNKFILCVALLCATFLPQFLSAQTLHTVTSTDDDGPGTLREAVNLAEKGDVIIFDARLQGKSIILEDEIIILHNLTIRGITDEDGNPALTIRVPVTYKEEVETGTEASNWRLFHIRDNLTYSKTVTFENLILKGGDIHDNSDTGPEARAAKKNNNSNRDNDYSDFEPSLRGVEVNNGGGVIMIRPYEDLVKLNNVLIGEARAYKGGGVYAIGRMIIENCTFEYNYALDGGALYDDESDLIEISKTSFFYNHAENEGGVIYEAYNADCIFDECYFAYNTADGDGAAIHTGNASTAFISKCSFFRNDAKVSGGAIQNANECFITIENSTFIDNKAQSGGAIYNANNAVLKVVNSTFTGNSANNPDPTNSKGAAIYTTSTAETILINNIILGNYIGDSPSGIQNSEIYVGVTEGTMLPAVLYMAYSLYGVIESEGTVDMVESITYDDINNLDAFLLEIYNAEWTTDSIGRYILLDVDTQEPIYEDDGHVLRISVFGRATYSGTLVAKADDIYYFRDFRDNVEDDDDDDYRQVNEWVSFVTSDTIPFNENLTLYGLEQLNNQSTDILSTAQNKDSNGNYISRIETHIAYTMGAYAFEPEEPGMIVNTNIDALNPFDELISLRDAAEAYSNIDFYHLGSEITFDSDVFTGTGATDTIKMNGHSIRIIQKDLFINGNGNDKVIIDAQKESRIFYILTSPSDSISITNVTLQNGFSEDYGGAISLTNSIFYMYNVKISGSQALAGGGMHLYQPPSVEVINCLFEGNIAEETAGAAYNEQGDFYIYLNCTFVKNEVLDDWGTGRAMHNLGVSPYIVNTVMWGNYGEEENTETLTYAGGEKYIMNCLIEGWTEEDDIDSLPGDTDPMFVDFDGGDYHPDRCSPLVNAGDNSYVEVIGITVDLDYEERIVYNTVDIGAYEAQNPAPPVAVWSPEYNVEGTDAERQDWNNPLNWDPQFVPAACSDVYIRSITPFGTNMHFPDLKDTTGICESIYFMQGGELANPQNLTYNHAHVQFNFGLQDTSAPQRRSDEVPVKECEIEERLEYSAEFTGGSIQRNQWNMLSAPLHSMVSGDFAFGGYPMTFMRKFDTSAPAQGAYPTGAWTELYASLNEELGLGEGFILWMNEYKNEDAYKEQNTGIDSEVSPASRTYGIYETNGIIELPYYADSILVDAHRIEKQDGTLSTFYYIWDETIGSDFLKLTGETDEYDRGENDKAYRFIVEEYVNGEWQFPATSTKPITNPNATAIEVLVGNPYMSTIDFIEFYNDNSSNIEPQYRLWTGDKFATATIVNGQIVSTDGLDQYISPMQSFFILTKGGGNFDLVYNVANITVPKPITSDSELRNAKSTKETNILRIKAENGLYTSETLIAQTNNASDNYKAGEDVYKLFSQKGNVPEIFTLADNYALEMNFINSNNILIPMGIKTQKTGTTTFTFTGMDNYESEKIEFIDGELNQTIDLTGQSIVEYTLNNLTEGINTGRFFIRFAEKQVTSITDMDEQIFVDAYRNENGIFITASDLIKQITVYDLQGHILYNNDVINSSWFTINQRFEANPVIVKVVTEKGVANIKLMKY